MSSAYDFRLIGADRPQGEIDVDDVVLILAKLQEVATRLGRVTMDAAHRGRPSARVDRVAKLRLTGLSAGSTVIQVARASGRSGLDFDLDEERDFDNRLDGLLAGLLTNERPRGANESIAAAVADLVVAFRRAAPQLEVRVDGKSRGVVATEQLRTDVWRAEPRPMEDIVIEGRLEKVDIRTGDFRVRDAVGISYPLPKVVSAADASLLIGQRVQVAGTAERNERGEVVAVRSATITRAPDRVGDAAVASAANVDGAPGSPEPRGLGEPMQLTLDEQDRFLEAMGF